MKLSTKARRMLMVAPVLFVAHFSAAIGDVVGTSGLIATGGPASLLGLWMLDAVVALGAAGVVASIMHRVDRAALTRRVAVACAGTALLYAWLVGVGNPGPVAFAIVAVGERLQNSVIYFAAWALVRDAYGSDVTQLARLRLLATAGQLSGAACAGAAAPAGVSRIWLLAPLAFSFLLVERTIAIGERAGGMDAAPGEAGGGSSIPPPVPAFASLRPTAASAGSTAPHAESAPAGGLRRTLRYLKESRHVRNLAVIGVLNGVGYSVLAFQVAGLLDAEGANNVDAMQTRYGILRTLEPLAYAAAEMLVAPLIVRRAGRMPVMALTPMVLLCSVVALFFVPTGTIGMIGSAALQASFAIESPALSSAIGSLPKRVRGQVGILLDSTPYTFGYVVAVILLGSIVLGQHLFHVTPWVSQALTCGLGVSTSVVALLAVKQLLRFAARAEKIIP